MPEEKEIYKDENGNEVEVKNIEFISQNPLSDNYKNTVKPYFSLFF